MERSSETQEKCSKWNDDMSADEGSSAPQKEENCDDDDDEVRRCRLSVYRRQVREKLNQRLCALIDSMEEQFKEVKLNMSGPAIKFALPWQHLDWQMVKKRVGQNQICALKDQSSNNIVKEELKNYQRKRKLVKSVKSLESSEMESDSEVENTLTKRLRQFNGKSNSQSLSPPPSKNVLSLPSFVKIRSSKNI